MNNKKSNFDLIDIHNHVGVDLLFYLNGHYPYAQSWPVLAKEADANGIEMLGVVPMVSHFALGIEGMRRASWIPRALWRLFLMNSKTAASSPNSLCLVGRIGEPSDCSGPCVFLCSPAAAYMAGQTLVVDGGLTITQI